ncbi:hypothetical protein [Lacipirellula parvula]|uniref:Uncharacterized protein n=1 Tax=Lacipirellula parvula TaxID=2650471 RepID=A0A5K7XM05_9BACT|nr:hypothetical protein [Lacipirellula parvula]BBO35583.1 hypothetical protein PLANPX_5195 [Lacipirellula parvula]
MSDSPNKFIRAFSMLLEAYDYAADTQSTLWDFAVPIRSLKECGLDWSDFRWLARKGFVRHAQEVTLLGDDGRDFRATGDLTFTRRTCFVLTESGVLAAAGACNKQRNADSVNVFSKNLVAKSRRPFAEDDGQAAGPSLTTPQPHIIQWDTNSRQLHMNGKLVKRFKWPAANQEALLNAFQEEHWPQRIDDPLPPQTDQDPKRRLADTIKCLNRKQINRLLQFHGDGTGEGVIWEVIEPA